MSKLRKGNSKHENDENYFQKKINGNFIDQFQDKGNIAEFKSCKSED